MRHVLLTSLLLLCSALTFAADNPHGELSLNCDVCHTTENWSFRPDASFDHNRDSDWSLSGTHENMECILCHPGQVYPGTARDCASCHFDQHEGALGLDCSSCHTTQDWQDDKYFSRLHDRLDFNLEGAHRSLECAGCHAGSGFGQYVETPELCVNCHQMAYDSSRDPDHRIVGFPHDCDLCHDTSTWIDATYAGHNSFPLDGAHAQISCSECHSSGQFAGTSTSCTSCHAAAVVEAGNPDHIQAGLQGECSNCHNSSGWQPATWSHAAETGQILVGAHVNLNCLSCHTDNNYQTTARSCSDCHLSEYSGVSSHVDTGYPLDCALCHDEDQWPSVQFNHAELSLPLEGAHAELACTSCHVSGVWEGLPSSCWSCHQVNYEEASPEHSLPSFGQDCRSCHTDIAWSPSSFEHANTAYELEGAHMGLDCAACHQEALYAGTPADCWSCHQPQFETAEPVHVSPSFDQDCSLCHDQLVWTPSSFEHANTDYELEGAHMELDCASCHQESEYEGTPADCWSCHQPQFETAEPVHVSPSFDQDCLVCHTQEAWQPALFDHFETSFPLNGAHQTVNCASCHVNSQYEGTPDQCWFCHEDQYNDAMDPNHSGEGFPFNCALCHTESNWDEVSYNHDSQYFPIYTGEHREEWQTCSDCHTSAGDFELFSCIHCHDHSQQEMEDEHDEVDDYIWESFACLDCHPNGQELGGSGWKHREQNSERKQNIR